MDRVQYGLTIKELPPEERPRERLALCGAQALATTELVAILLETGSARRSALDLARGLLAEAGGLRCLAEQGYHELQRLPGIGPAKAAKLKAALELGRRLAGSSASRARISCPSDAGQLLMEEMRYLDREHFRVILLNTKNHVIGVEQVSVGSLASSVVHPREVFKGALARSAAAVILVHNHPSGDPAPSREDLDVTGRLVEAGRLLGVEVLDHIVIGDNAFVSLREKGHGWGA
ncbi:MAG: DNA repair protein RadC [bacterium]|nr:DNA repair protein RadC [bacterium]